MYSRIVVDLLKTTAKSEGTGYLWCGLRSHCTFYTVCMYVLTDMLVSLL